MVQLSLELYSMKCVLHLTWALCIPKTSSLTRSSQFSRLEDTHLLLSYRKLCRPIVMYIGELDMLSGQMTLKQKQKITVAKLKNYIKIVKTVLKKV